MLKLVLCISSVFLFIIKKLSGANFTTSGEEVPDAPVLFLANHFTRFETFIVPYLLFNKRKRIARSLADDTVFVGWLGEYLRLAGSVSTKNKARDCIITDDFLSGKADWIIYPEGHMVKNKQITFDNGEFCIHTAIRQGPVHTGAAVLALKAELMRQKVKESNDDIKSIKRFCSIHDVDVDRTKINEDVTLNIVPLSITYYPIRPGKNKLLLWLDKRFNLRGTRLFEELEIEINLLMDANMHLHFGKPISAEKYIEDYKDEHGGSLDDDDFAARLFDGQRKKVINDAMEKVYGNMQVNFDHIFILSLVTMPTLKVCPSYLKTLIYKNARELRKIEGLNLHPELETDLFELILDKDYEPFLSAIKLAETQKILYRDSEGDYLFDKNLLEQSYDFNKVRVKNTLQVILNEIKWQKNIVESANHNATFSEQELRIDNFEHLQKQDWNYYEKEYLTYHDEVPAKENVGAPTVWFDAKNSTGLVFSHGYMAAPAEAGKLAEYLFERGINVYLPRLRGHGTDPEALKHVSADDWELDFKRAFTAMRQVCDKVFIGGFSTGGLLALLHAAQHEVDGVIAINSALKLNNLQVSYIVPTLHAFNEMIAYLHAKGIKEWVENSSENPDINYAKHPLASIAQMEKIMTKVDKTLNTITDPILVLQGDEDPVVNSRSAQLIYNRVNASMKKLVLVPRANHIIITGEGEEEIFESVHRFIGDVLKKSS
ncbi:MAG: alpha/beta fold hydrolase [Deltaproteobacteria bacterium]|nr:alpha/beta fold hydrolase [Deltaproteobacteria bacterium]